jgi:hypothetical protein
MHLQTTAQPSGQTAGSARIFNTLLQSPSNLQKPKDIDTDGGMGNSSCTVISCKINTMSQEHDGKIRG